MFATARPMDPEVRAAYLTCLDLEAEPPSADALSRLVQRHAERVPYETFWIAAGERWSIDPVSSASRIASGGRGGYCYHLNGALGLLLSSLGYRVVGHCGGVQAGDPNPDAMGNHLALTVHGLPTESNPSGSWYVDNGLGDALHEPLPLVAGEYVQAPFRLTLERSGDTTWQLTHDPEGGFRSMTWRDEPARLSDFARHHEWLSSSPDSGFVQVPMAERRDATGVDVMRGLVRTRIGSGAFTAEPITVESEWFDALAAVFGMHFAGESRIRLWASVLTSHQKWLEAHG